MKILDELDEADKQFTPHWPDDFNDCNIDLFCNLMRNNLRALIDCAKAAKLVFHENGDVNGFALVGLKQALAKLEGK